MELKTWLNQERGRATALAAFLNLSLGRISQIADEGVPKKYLLRVQSFTNNEVTLEAMLLPKLDAAPQTQAQPAPQEASHG